MSVADKFKILFGQFKSAEVDFPHLHHHLRISQTAIDTAAGAGEYAHRMSKIVGPYGRVYAFSNADCYNRLNGNATFSGSNMVPFSGPAHPGMFTVTHVDFIRCHSLSTLKEFFDVLKRCKPKVLLRSPEGSLSPEDETTLNGLLLALNYRKFRYPASPNVLLIPEGYNYA